MLLKKPKSNKRPVGIRVLRTVILFEALIFGASYLAYNRMNRSRDFRKWMNDTFPQLLMGYYALGEMIDPENKRIQKQDLIAWRQADQAQK